MINRCAAEMMHNQMAIYLQNEHFVSSFDLATFFAGVALFPWQTPGCFFCCIRLCYQPSYFTDPKSLVVFCDLDCLKCLLWSIFASGGHYSFDEVAVVVYYPH